MPVISQTPDAGEFQIKSLYTYAIQEDVKSILTSLDTIPDSRLSDTDKILKKKFYERFAGGNEIFDYGTTDELIKGAIDIYRKYWTSILLKEKNIEDADKELMQSLTAYLESRNTIDNQGVASEIRNDPMKYFSKLLSSKGFFNNVDGKTGNLYDIYIWTRQDTAKYDVELPDGKINVPVLFMKDIITLGWEEYATFGTMYPGGWPHDGVLYCVDKAYNTSEEKFLIHYLLHESQHFLDMKNYEEIPAWHLEYRAKLAEMSKADKNLEKQISYFIRGGKDDSTLSHPYAEFLVIKDLSRRLFNEEFVSDIERWKQINKELIHSASSDLLLEDTKLMIPLSNEQ